MNLAVRLRKYVSKDEVRAFTLRGKIFSVVGGIILLSTVTSAAITPMLYQASTVVDMTPLFIFAGTVGISVVAFGAKMYSDVAVLKSDMKAIKSDINSISERMNNMTFKTRR